ncbi:hypothetical protein OIU34_19435 [Pararhizobium sp. BT-229]|uniref:hypothetical protein n=1 Tax=Pararhizobium sp. BT-229 TaxID=2986923 RepID=UPI0021F75780|nr:hypothetical protein [Pararhizobium sp. BT-229]MCV9964057.1 hypothetical protein [Pararhizobium sp. BT-229]
MQSGTNENTHIVATTAAPSADLAAFIEAAWQLSTWAASIHWDGRGNTEEWLGDLRAKIELVQAMTPGVKVATYLAAREVEWRDIETAPRNKHVIVISKRFPEPHEAMLYDNGWHTWGANGSYKDDPYLWTDLPEPPAGTVTSETIDLESETRRLKADYPHLTPRFAGPHGDTWTCDLTTMTMLKGEWGVYTGWGKTKVLALLDARQKPDTERAEKEARERAQAVLRQAETDRENAKDNEMFAAI